MFGWQKEIVNTLFSSVKESVDIHRGQRIKYDNIPQKLYKYCAFNDYSIENLKSNQIWLSFPDSFNDPYDCALTFDSKALLDYFFISNTLKTFPNVNAETINTYEELMKVCYPNIPQDDQYTKDTMSKQYSLFNNLVLPLSQNNKKKIVVSCFSEINNSIRMWSHYADKHKGFCIEYDFKSLPMDDLITICLYPVLYQDKLFDITDYLKNIAQNSSYIFYAAISKSIEWEYEKEWRLIYSLDKQVKERVLSVPYPKAIYLGVKISKENQNILEKYSNENDIPLYRAEMNLRNYGINFHKI